MALSTASNHSACTFTSPVQQCLPFSNVRARSVASGYEGLRFGNLQQTGVVHAKARPITQAGATQLNIDGSQQHSGVKPGWIYIASNPCMHGLLKIGKTTVSARQRLTELGRPTGVPASFALELSIKVQNCDTGEKLAHQALAKYRVNGKEFFKISVGAAVKKILWILGDYQIDDFHSDNESIPAIAQELNERKLEAERRAKAKAHAEKVAHEKRRREAEKRAREAEKQAKAEAHAQRIARVKRKKRLATDLLKAYLELRQLGTPPTMPEGPPMTQCCNRVADYLDDLRDNIAVKTKFTVFSIVVAYIIGASSGSAIVSLTAIFLIVMQSNLLCGLVDKTVVSKFVSFLARALSKILRKFSATLWDSKNLMTEYSTAIRPYELVVNKVNTFELELNKLKRECNVTSGNPAQQTPNY